MSVNHRPPECPQIYDTMDAYFSAFGGILPPDMFNNIIPIPVSCGVSMLSGLTGASPQQIVDKVLKERAVSDRKKIREAFVVFSDTDHDGRHWEPRRGGNALYTHIRDNNLGQIMEFGPRQNPNTNNMIKLWVWLPPHADLTHANKQMPVYGKVQVKDQYGSFSRYDDDSRFVSNLNPHLNVRPA